MPNIQLTPDEFRAMASMARFGADTPDRARAIDTYIRAIEDRNGIHRYTLWVQWQEAGTPLPPSTNFPEKWPPELRELLELDRPIIKSDVDALLARVARRPVTVLVTADPGQLVGWTPYGAYFG